MPIAEVLGNLGQRAGKRIRTGVRNNLGGHAKSHHVLADQWDQWRKA